MDEVSKSGSNQLLLRLIDGVLQHAQMHDLGHQEHPQQLGVVRHWGRAQQHSAARVCGKSRTNTRRNFI